MSHSPDSYVAVIFTSTCTFEHVEECSLWAAKMSDLVKAHPGFISEVSARNQDTGFGITISYFKDMESVDSWKAVQEHQRAQKLGRKKFYLEYSVKVATVFREYEVNIAD